MKKLSKKKSKLRSLVSPDAKKRLKKIKMMICDVDGVLTDGNIFWQDGIGWTRFYNVKDGYGLIMLKKAGIRIGIISAGDSEDLKQRIRHLEIEDFSIGSHAKLDAFNKILSARGLRPDEVAYMGDELFDIPVLEASGFGATVPHAVERVQKAADYCTKHEGGYGAVREVADAILEAQGLDPFS